MMATKDCNPLSFLDTTETAFFFEEPATGVFEDAFNRSRETQVWMKSKENKFLIFNDEEKQFEFQNVTTEVQQSHPEDKFNIQFYKDSKTDTTGRAVILYSYKDGKKMVVCCNEKGEIHPVEMEPPENIKEVKHRAVFYRVKTETRYTFRSSLFPSKFLGFELFNDALKLVLHTMEHDEMDERCTFSLHDK